MHQPSLFTPTVQPARQPPAPPPKPVPTPASTPALPPEPEDRLLTEKEAASKLAISPRKLWEIRNQKLIPHIRIGQCVRYDPDDLDAWIQSQKTGTGCNTTP